MTDQRPIDPSTLRDGDIVRAKRGEYGVVEGVFHSYPISSGWGIGSEAEEDGLFAWNDKGWTITAILRPVLVKGDRVEWVGASRKRKASTATVCQVNGDYVAVIRDDDVADKWPIEAVRRLPTAPEPAPIKVGDWWQQPENGTAWVVVERNESALAIPCGHVLVGLRRIDQNADVILWYREEVVQRDWTRLDGPPEPKSVGSIVTVRSTGGVDRVAIRDTFGWYVTGWTGVRSWAEVLYEADLATLRILGSVD